MSLSHLHPISTHSVGRAFVLLVEYMGEVLLVVGRITSQVQTDEYDLSVETVDGYRAVRCLKTDMKGFQLIVSTQPSSSRGDTVGTTAYTVHYFAFVDDEEGIARARTGIASLNTTGAIRSPSLPEDLSNYLAIHRFRSLVRTRPGHDFIDRPCAQNHA